MWFCLLTWLAFKLYLCACVLFHVRRFAHFDSASLDLLKACLDPEPKNRPTAVQLLTHNYFMVAKAVLDPYTMAAVKAQAAAKELAARSQHAAADSQLQERPSPAKPSRETAFAAATAAAAAAAASRGGSNPQLPMSQLGAPARKSGGGAAGAHQGGGPDEDPENIGRGETNSDGGAQGLDDPDNEYETEVPIDELLSPEKRAKIQAWVDALPDVKPHGRQATVAAAAASAAGSAAHSPILSPHRGMDGLGTHPMDAYGAGQSAPNSGVQLQSHLGLLSGHGALSPTAQIAGPSATPATPTHAAASALKAALGHHAADTSPQQHSGPLATLRARGGTDGGSIADRHSPGGIGGYARGPGDAIVGDRPSPIRGGLAMHRPQSALNALLQNAGPLACDPPSVLSVQSGTIPYGSVTHGSPGMQPVRRSTSNMTSVLDSMNVENLVMNNLQLATSPGTPQTPGTHGTGELAAANPAWLASVLSPGSGAAQGVNPSPQSQGTRPAVGASPGRTPTKQSSSSRLGVLGILESGAPRKALSQNGVTVTADTPSQPQPVAAQPSLPQPQPPAARAPLGMGHESPGGRRRTISNNGSTAQASTPVTAMTKLLENTKSESLVISPTQHAPSPLQLLMQQHRASMDGGSGQVPVPVATSPGSAMDALARLAGRRTNDGMATVQPPAAPASTGFLEAVAKLATPGPSAAPLATVTSSGLVTASGAAARPAAPGALTAQPQATTPTEQAKEPSYLEKIKQLAAVRALKYHIANPACMPSQLFCARPYETNTHVLTVFTERVLCDHLTCAHRQPCLRMPVPFHACIVHS